MTYLKAATGDFSAFSSYDDMSGWDRFMRAFIRHGKGRIQLESKLYSQGEQVAEFLGTYVAFNRAQR
jgi:hypothetical protein